MKIQPIIHSIFPRKIKSAPQLNEVLNAVHTPHKVFGIKFRDSFKLEQDVFEKAMEFRCHLNLPENIFLKFKGQGDKSLGLYVPEGTTFKAPQAAFSSASTKGKKIVVDSIEGNLESYGTSKSQVRYIGNEANSHDKSHQKNGTVRYANSFDKSVQSNEIVQKSAESHNWSKQTNGKAQSATSSDNSHQINGEVTQNAVSKNFSDQTNGKIHEYASSEDNSYQTNGHVVKDAIASNQSKQTNTLVSGRVKTFDFARQLNYKVKGNAFSYNMSHQKNFDIKGDFIAFDISEQINNPKHVKKTLAN